MNLQISNLHYSMARFLYTLLSTLNIKKNLKVKEDINTKSLYVL